jgi:hypothetical protein
MEPDDSTRRADGDALVALELSRRARRRRAQGGLGDMIGNAVVGFDYQVFRATKPPAILVESAKPVRGLSGEGGATLLIGYPDETLADEGEPGAPGTRGPGREPDAGSTR